MKASFNFGYLETPEAYTPGDLMTLGSLVALCGVAGTIFGLFGAAVVVGGYIFGIGLANWHVQARTTKAVEDALAEVKAAGEPIFAKGHDAASWANPHVGGGGATGGNGQ